MTPEPGAPGAPTVEVSIVFTAGQGGALAATFQPSTQGFAGVYGPIRLFIDPRVAGEEGQVSLEVMYTPEAPAVLTGAFREALEDGSLDLYAGIEVMKPGRYGIAARADDAEGGLRLHHEALRRA